MIRTAAAVIACVMFAGCVSRQVLAPEYLLLDSTKLVHLTLRDGSVLTFAPNRYSAERMSDSVLVFGTGQRTMPNAASGNERFEGSVNLSQIAELQVVDHYFPYALWYPVMVVTGAALIGWTYILFHPR